MQQRTKKSSHRDMRRHRSAAGLLSGLLLLLALPISAVSAPGFQPQPPARGFVQPDRRVGRMINLNQAIRIVQQESGGRVLSAKSVQAPNGALRHHVRVLIDGQRVATLVVDQQGRLRRVR